MYIPFDGQVRKSCYSSLYPPQKTVTNRVPSNKS